MTVPTPALVARGFTEAHLVWTDATGGTPPYSYTLLWSTTPGGVDNEDEDTGLQGSAVQLSPGTKYYIRVRAIDATDTLADSAEVQVTTLSSNVELDLYRQIVDLLEGNAAWAELIPEGNRIWYSDLEGDEVPDKSIVADADYGQAILLQKSGTTDLWDTNPTFATHSDIGPQFWSEKHQYQFRLILTSQLLSVNEITQLGSVTRNALRLGGPRLGGLMCVNSLKLRWDQADRKEAGESGETDGKREVVTIDLFVGTDIDGVILSGATS